MIDHDTTMVARREAFEQEAIPHMDSLYRAAQKLSGNPTDAEDLVQEAFVKAYRYWDKYETGSNCRAWLYRILTNVFINQYRSQARSPMVPSTGDIDEQFLFGRMVVDNSASNPEREFYCKVVGEDVNRAIKRLPDDFRLVVILTFMEGFSYRQTAEITGLNLGTVKSRLHRGRKLLQKQLWDHATRNGYIGNKVT
jgi:RNA polymerase sigma-70 factor (ECF subfamily)